MPRPKVNPKDRKRSVRACLPCKASKIRCDANSPCNGCRRRGKVASCVYLDPEPSPRRPTAHATASAAETADLPSGAIPQSTPRATSNDASRRRSQQAGPAPVRAAAHATPATPSSQSQIRMLLNSKGEKRMSQMCSLLYVKTLTVRGVYIGETASLSYLQFVRHVLKKCMGPTHFTENEFTNYMLETEPLPNVSNASTILDQDQKRSLVQSYLEGACLPSALTTFVIH